MSGREPKVVAGERLARGETSDIYAATRDGEDVVLKVLHPHLAEDPIVSSRFVREAEILASVRHPNIVRVNGLTSWDGRPAMVMERVRGGSLAERLAATGPMTAETTLRLVRDLLGALETIHAKGIVHRDIRPSHILWESESTVQLTDFGMASIRDLSGLTRSTVFTSRPNYADPYTWGAGRPVPQIDLYGLGAVAYECLRGAPLPVRLFGERGSAREQFLSEFAEAEPGVLGWIVPLLLAPLDQRPRSAAEARNWIESGHVEGSRDLSECIACGAPMPREAPLCLACGHAPIVVQHDPNGEFLALRSISEAQEILSPFLRKLRLLSESREPLPKLLIGDQRLYSKAERDSGVRLPVRIADELATESVDELIELLGGDRPDKVRLVSRPMAAVGRMKRGPLIRIRSGAQLPPPTLAALKRLVTNRPDTTATDSQRDELETLRTECRYAIAMAAARTASPEPELIERLGGLLGDAVDRLAQMEAYLATVDLPAAYADYEQSLVRGGATAERRDWAAAVFAEHAKLERSAAALRVRITDACRLIEAITEAGTSNVLTEARNLLGGPDDD
jgi:serine/threonine protein kinase